MKDSDIKDEHLKIYEGLYSGAIYELHLWECDMEKNGAEPSDEEILTEMRETGRVECAPYRHTVAYFPTLERAQEDLCMFHECAWESDVDLDVAIICQRVAYWPMPPECYFKEWTYEWGARLADETLVRNFNKEEYPFLGRPQEMIHHAVGDIVMVVRDPDNVHWGIVCALPPTPEEVKDRRLPLDWSDDCYVVLTADTGYASHEHVLAHRVVRPHKTPPAKVRGLLREGLRKAREEDKTK